MNNKNDSAPANAKAGDVLDAQRYQLLRRADVNCDQFHHMVSDDCHPPTWQLKRGADLDAAVDAALAHPVAAQEGG